MLIYVFDVFPDVPGFDERNNMGQWKAVRPDQMTELLFVAIVLAGVFPQGNDIHLFILLVPPIDVAIGSGKQNRIEHTAETMIRGDDDQCNASPSTLSR